ncbi:hypothetical protein [Glycomyces arizonensis]|uniref:hypothetical protein n=1 Tax=Glycomyces arizonensis TaxID=256035 RepID=UPI00047EECAB|nr:hypothetical protein [Glycomyces arizonensis]
MGLASEVTAAGMWILPADDFELLVLGILVALFYAAVHAAIFPWRKCRWCDGSGKRFSRRTWYQPRTYRPCWCCHGTGKHLRLTRRKITRRRERG